MSLFKLFLIFVKTGAILIGGGYVIFPLLQREFVEKRNLISNDDLTNYFAIAQSLPGIIAANMSMFIGYKLMGKKGAIIAMLGVIFVPFWCIIILATLLNSVTDNLYIQGVLSGVGIAVVALILLTVRELWQKSNRTVFFYIILITALAALSVFKLSPVNTILLCSSLGLIIKIIMRRFAK